jgi:hypothetical protein
MKPPSPSFQATYGLGSCLYHSPSEHQPRRRCESLNHLPLLFAEFMSMNQLLLSGILAATALQTGCGDQEKAAFPKRTPHPKHVSNEETTFGFDTCVCFELRWISARTFCEHAIAPPACAFSNNKRTSPASARYSGWQAVKLKVYMRAFSRSGSINSYTLLAGALQYPIHVV